MIDFYHLHIMTISSRIQCTFCSDLYEPLLLVILGLLSGCVGLLPTTALLFLSSQAGSFCMTGSLAAPESRGRCLPRHDLCMV